MKKVLLFSGGLDSYITATLSDYDILLYVAMGHRYMRRELQILEKSDLPNIHVTDMIRLDEFELDNAIIPLRNLHLILCAFHWGDEVSIGALKGEVNPDKSPEFRDLAERIVNVCYAKSYWSDGAKRRVHFPVINFNKTDLIAEFLHRGGDPERLKRYTRSCYSSKSGQCGRCSACVKRFIAMNLNGIEEHYREDPRESPELKKMADRWETFDLQRKAELSQVFPEIFRAYL